MSLWKMRDRCFWTVILVLGLLHAIRPAGAQEAPVIRWSSGVGNSLSQPAEFYGSPEAARVAETVLLYQRENGGWPKNYDRAATLSEAEKQKILAEKSENRGTTFDNGATHSEIRYLARTFNGSGDARFRQAAIRGVQFTLSAQYPSGGWPQIYPPPSSYHRHITFNDGAMEGLMTALRDIAQDRETYGFIDEELRRRCEAALTRGIQCILDCQIVVDGRKTAWCAQHDPDSLAPALGRSYELPSISGSESVGVVRFLMSIESPSPEIIDAVQSAVRWFHEARLTGMREVRVDAPDTPRGWDKEIIEDPDAPPLWARFYTIGTNKPIFCSRDGVPRENLADISYERRTGYSWLGPYARDLLARDYPAWQAKWAPDENVLESGREP